MKYELAKKLKELGFPGSENWWEWSDGTAMAFGGNEPNLEELIDACSTRVKLDWYPETQRAFVSCCDRKDHEVIGSTPEEAVARLWLALNQVEV